MDVQNRKRHIDNVAHRRSLERISLFLDVVACRPLIRLDFTGEIYWRSMQIAMTTTPNNEREMGNAANDFNCFPNTWLATVMVANGAVCES